jgi:hypothetical protein
MAAWMRTPASVSESADGFLPHPNVLVMERPVERALHSLVRDPAEHVDDVPDHVPARVAEPLDEDFDVVAARDRERLAERAAEFHLVHLAEEIADRRSGGRTELD